MITPIKFLTSTNFQQPKKTQKAQKAPKTELATNNISFGVRLEYKLLEQNYSVRASNYFRRGKLLGSQKEEFQDVIDALKLILSKNKKPSILIAGIGEAQEPFSVLAVIKDLSKGKDLNASVDLNCVDLQPKISDLELEKTSILGFNSKPLFAVDSFLKTEDPQYSEYYRYKIKPEIFEHLKEVFDNPSKTKWDTKIEEFSAVCPPESYHMISANNILGYLPNKDAQNTTMENFHKMLKPNGILITDPLDSFYRENFNCLKNFKNLNQGIWQKMG